MVEIEGLQEVHEAKMRRNKIDSIANSYGLSFGYKAIRNKKSKYSKYNPFSGDRWPLATFDSKDDNEFNAEKDEWALTVWDKERLHIYEKICEDLERILGVNITIRVSKSDPITNYQ